MCTLCRGRTWNSPAPGSTQYESMEFLLGNILTMDFTVKMAVGYNGLCRVLKYANRQQLRRKSTKKSYVVQIPTRPLNSYIEFKYYILLSISTLNQRCPLIYFRWISETYYHRRSDQIVGMRKRIVLGRTILAARVSKDPRLGRAPFKTLSKSIHLYDN